MILAQKFFARSTLRVARELLGKFLVRKYRGKIYEEMITETEAYIGESDLACHASRGRTSRSEVLYAKPGTFYIYLIYGIHNMFNVVTEKENFPAAVLIRAVEGVNGPGRLTKAFHIDRSLHGRVICDNIWFEDKGIKISSVKKSPRIGVDYAGLWARKPWRFYVGNKEG